MSTATSIEWTRGDDGSAGATWNPVTGCREVSEGCEHCYAKTFAERFRGVAGHPFEQGFDIQLWPQRLALPFRWRKARRVFVNSMSDLFFDARQVPDDFVARVFATMAATPQHTYQVLTKRPGPMASLLGDEAFRAEVAHHLLALSCAPDGRPDPAFLERASNPWAAWPLPNVWVGTSIELDRYAWRADLLRRALARVRFLSLEPLLGPLPSLDLAGIDWVIVGGESGSGHRPLDLDRVRDLRDRCVGLGIAFFFKQVGGRTPKAGGRLLDGRTWDQMPSTGPQIVAATGGAR